LLAIVVTVAALLMIFLVNLDISPDFNKVRPALTLNDIIWVFITGAIIGTIFFFFLLFWYWLIVIVKFYRERRANK
jgi:hypothetical protein